VEVEERWSSLRRGQRCLRMFVRESAAVGGHVGLALIQFQRVLAAAAEAKRRSAGWRERIEATRLLGVADPK